MAKSEYEAITRTGAQDLVEVLPSQEDIGWETIAITEGPNGFTAFLRRRTG